MIHCRLKEETLERLNTKKMRLFLDHGRVTHDFIINRGLDALDGKQLRKLERRVHELTKYMGGLSEANYQWRQDYKKVVEEKGQLELMIGQLRSQLNAMNKDEYERAIEEKKDLELQVEQTKRELAHLKFVHGALSKDYDTLKGRLEELENPDIDSLRNMIEEKEKIIVLKNSEIEKLNRLTEENGLKLRNAEELIDANKRKKSELLELRSENDKLIIALNNRASEFRFVKETINNEIDRIGKLGSIIDVMPALTKLKEDLNRKIDFELQEQTELIL